MKLLNNIIENFINLQKDFQDISINFIGFVNYFLNILITVFIFLLFYYLGKKINDKFFIINKQYYFFINIALGFAITGTGIGLMGILSILTPSILISYLFILSFIAFYPLKQHAFSPIKIKRIIKKFIADHNIYIVLGVFTFVVISFIRLSVPEIAEDGYHTDLPSLYLAEHTSLLESKEMLRVVPYPQLPEMIYLIPIFLEQKEATRFIHFGFYLFIVFLLFKVGRKYPVAKYAPLLFVTAPLVIRYSPSQHTDFFAVYCFLLAGLILSSKITTKTLILAGVLFGAVISTKVWMLVYLPAILLYVVSISKIYKLLPMIKMSAVFISSALLVSLIWHVRAYLITGNPIFPIFSTWQLLGEPEPVAGSLATFIGLNIKMFAYENLVVYSPLFFLGVFLILFNIKKFMGLVRRFPIAILVLFIFIEQLFIQVYLGRYLVTLYTLSTLVISVGIFLFIKYKYFKYAFGSLTIIIFTYYLINTLLILPYGFGWADKNNYLTRVLGRDNVSYYDFDGLFNRWIEKDDLVATYGIGSFYYADFSYIDMGYIFDQDTRSFDQLKKRGVTKVLIKGGDMEWFSEKISMTGYDKSKVKLLATYPSDIKKYNLYSIEN